MSPFDLAVDGGADGAVALITGGASGLGRAVAEVFGEAGYRLVIADLDEDQGRAACETLASHGIEAHFVATDVSNPEHAEAAIHTAMTAWGRLDFVFNNAGIVGHGAAIEDLDAEDLDRVLAVDLKGPFHISRSAVRAMKPRASGSILNVASITAQLGSAYFAPYAAAKAGVIAMTESIARNVGRAGIRVNCLNPGSITGTALMAANQAEKSATQVQRETLSILSRIPLARQAQPRDIAHLALFLASPLARHIHGATITIDGGERLGYH